MFIECVWVRLSMRIGMRPGILKILKARAMMTMLACTPDVSPNAPDSYFFEKGNSTNVQFIDSAYPYQIITHCYKDDESILPSKGEKPAALRGREADFEEPWEAAFEKREYGN